MTVEYLDLADYVSISAEVTGLDIETVMKVANLDLADSALHAPAGPARAGREPYGGAGPLSSPALRSAAVFSQWQGTQRGRRLS